MKLLIEIPEEVKIAFDCAESNDLKGCYYDHGGVIGNAIKNGKPFTDVLNEIKAEILQLDYDLDDVDYDYNDMAQTEEVHMICREEVLQIIDKHK